MVFQLKQKHIKAAPADVESGDAEKRIPRHVAIIMDGNGRWAKAKGLPRVAGHKKGMDAVRAAIRACASEGVDYLTLYAFSSENWGRPADEVAALMDLLRTYIRSEINELIKEGVKLSFIGDRDNLAPDILRLIEDAEAQTANNSRLNVQIALSYGSRAEIARAARHIAEAVKAGELDPAAVDETCVERYLYTAGVPDPDMIIRTGGERRLSNFLMWQAAYAELVYFDEFWPDFGQTLLREAINIYSKRERRFGKRK